MIVCDCLDGLIASSVSVVSVSTMLLVSASSMLVYTVQKNIAQVLFLGDIFLFPYVGRILMQKYE